jgi:hypothetical protein
MKRVYSKSQDLLLLDRELKSSKKKLNMTKFINVTIAKGSEEGLEVDTPLTLNTHYVIKVMKTTEDEMGNASIALATGEFIFVTETIEDLLQQLR